MQVTPVDTGYALAVEGLPSFFVPDGYRGALDDVARDLIAKEVGRPADELTVDLHYGLMTRYRRKPRFSWSVLLLGLVTLSVAAIGLATLNPLLASIGGVGTFGLIVVRLVAPHDTKRIE